MINMFWILLVAFYVHMKEYKPILVRSWCATMHNGVVNCNQLVQTMNSLILSSYERNKFLTARESEQQAKFSSDNDVIGDIFDYWRDGDVSINLEISSACAQKTRNLTTNVSNYRYLAQKQLYHFWNQLTTNIE